MKKRWILIGLISLFGYKICDQLDKPKKHNLTFEKIITVKSKTKPKVKVKVKKDVDYWIKLHSKKHNLDWKMVKAIMIFESGLNPKAKNPNSSAFGLSQFILRTGQWVYKELGYKNCVSVPSGTSNFDWVEYNKYFLENREIILCYDNDDAGRKAEEKAIKKLQGIAKNIKVINLNYDGDINNV